MSKLIDLTGQKIGRLTVLCREGTYQRPSGNKEPTWRCKCECGNEVVVLSSNLKKKGNTLSCGCLQAENRKAPRRETEYEIRGEVAYVKSFDGVEFIINTCDLDAVLNHRWHRNGHGYMANEHGNTIHRFLMKPPAVMDVHHINENKLDNRRINLLMMSRSEHTALHQRKDIANGVTVQKWISVKKKCPRLRERKYYTVPNFDGTHEYTSSGFVIGLAENKPVIVEYCEEDVFAPWRDKAGYRSWFDENGKKQDVTHWMPLPSTEGLE